ncbi:basic salivary proline-rich protein 1-like [Anabas testudineus]|uniref:basic salivary proline-rich protein 1-like n=1 Tax=Anabas testudineus TaxID=64144 RepID=UPI000E46044C|nr:basic salivary proline-rich protein 1-like [Anabas testudineus]
MQLFLVAAFLLSAVAALPPASGRPGKPPGPPKGDLPPMNRPVPQGPGGQPGKSQSPPKMEENHMNKTGPFGKGGKPGKHQGGSKSEERHMKNPGPPGNIEFSPAFKVDNVTFQNITNVTLQQGENLFLMPKHGERVPRHFQGRKHGPPRNGQYVKLIYNSTLPNMFSMEFGVFRPKNVSELVAEGDDDEGADW